MPSSRDLPDPGIKPASLMSPVLAGKFFIISTTWEALGRRQWHPTPVLLPGGASSPISQMGNLRHRLSDLPKEREKEIVAERGLRRQRVRGRGLSLPLLSPTLCMSFPASLPVPALVREMAGGPDGEQVGAVAPGWPEPLTPPKFSKPFSQCPGE